VSVFLRFNKFLAIIFFSQEFLRFWERLLNLALTLRLELIVKDCFSMMISNWWLDWWAIRNLWNVLNTCMALLVWILNRLVGIGWRIGSSFIGIEIHKMSWALNDSRWKERLAFWYFWLPKN
jgi:hypothetical protein